MKVTKPRLPSTKTTRTTIRARTAELSEYRNFVSKGESSTQLQDEIKVTTTEERELLLSELQKGGFKVDVSTSQSLGMKADLNIPWAKLRVIRRYYYTPTVVCRFINVHNVQVVQNMGSIHCQRAENAQRGKADCRRWI